MKRKRLMERIDVPIAKVFPAAATAVALVMIAGAAQAAEITITQRGKKFMPDEVTIRVGDTIRFVNDDNVTHNVHSMTTGHEFDFGGQKVGVTTNHTFTEPGVVKVQCAIHPKMKLVVTVQ